MPPLRFGVGTGFAAALPALVQVEDAKSVFMAILPVSAEPTTFRSAGRNTQQHDIAAIAEAFKSR